MSTTPHEMPRRIAVLNRGEAAVRFLRTLRTWRAARGVEVEAVAFYTDPDADALFVRLADEAEPIGPALRAGADGRMASAYCDAGHVIERLVETGCEAVWPGWGFVSEDAAFVERLEAAGILFIGPRAETLRALGDKIAARQRAEAAGVPLAPWATLPEDAATARWIEAAARVGYPLMVKASAGGGGRGIRRVDSAEALPAALAAVRTEAARSFGGGGVLLEACVQGGRHVEVQLVGDGRGQAWALGVRDCSIQRRHQKIIEESPSPILPASVAQLIQSSATRLAASVGYRGVGTAEFLYAPADGLTTFLEVNARLQVEHPLTELTSGLDLVEAQLDIAFGLPFEPPGEPRGHAIEARLNAEDPAHGFAPRPGRLRVFRPPTGPGVRVDTGVEEGQAIAPEFDSMIAKIIAHGATRAQARARLDAALAELDLVVEDGATNRAFLRAVLAHPAFIDGSADTAWLDRHAPALVRPVHADEALAAAALLVARQGRDASILQYFREVQGGIPHRLPPPDGALVELSMEGVHRGVRVLDRPGDTQAVAVDGQVRRARLALEGAHAGTLELDGRVHRVLFAEGATGLSVEVDGEAHHVERAAGGVIQAPMPAVVVAVAVAPGDAVAAGDVLCTVEAMKMETTICAPLAGVVRQVAVRVHQQVASGQALVLLDPAGVAAPMARSAAAAEAVVDPRAWTATESATRVEALAEAVRALLLGFDLAPADRRRTLDALEAAAAGPLAAPAAFAPLVDLLAAYADTQALFDRHLQPAAGEAVAISAERAFHGWCRARPGRGGARSPPGAGVEPGAGLAWRPLDPARRPRRGVAAGRRSRPRRPAPPRLHRAAAPDRRAAPRRRAPPPGRPARDPRSHRRPGRRAPAAGGGPRPPRSLPALRAAPLRAPGRAARRRGRPRAGPGRDRHARHSARRPSRASSAHPTASRRCCCARRSPTRQRSRPCSAGCTSTASGRSSCGRWRASRAGWRGCSATTPSRASPPCSRRWISSPTRWPSRRIWRARIVRSRSWSPGPTSWRRSTPPSRPRFHQRRPAWPGRPASPSRLPTATRRCATAPSGGRGRPDRRPRPARHPPRSGAPPSSCGAWPPSTSSASTRPSPCTPSTRPPSSTRATKESLYSRTCERAPSRPTVPAGPSSARSTRPSRWCAPPRPAATRADGCTATASAWTCAPWSI
ncbi:MAG: biotin carboxylase N-terminal domain-containing protein [bacterium]